MFGHFGQRYGHAGPELALPKALVSASSRVETADLDMLFYEIDFDTLATGLANGLSVLDLTDCMNHNIRELSELKSIERG